MPTWKGPGRDLEGVSLSLSSSLPLFQQILGAVEVLAPPPFQAGQGLQFLLNPANIDFLDHQQHFQFQQL